MRTPKVARRLPGTDMMALEKRFERGVRREARASSRSVATSVSVAVAVLMVAGCIAPPRERVESLPDLPYPRCDADEGATTRLGGGELRAGPVMRESSVVESFELFERGCHVVFEGALDWNLGATDLEVVYDRELRPIRAWKRSTSPGPLEARERTDIRSYDFRGDRLAMRRLSPGGELELWLFRHRTPEVIIGPGRGLLSVWLRRARLDVGGRIRQPIADIRESIEVVRDATLMRHADREDEILGHVRVYTIYGREPIFADDNDIVVGDLAGLVRARDVAGPLPQPVPREGPRDPRGTP